MSKKKRAAAKGKKKATKTSSAEQGTGLAEVEPQQEWEEAVESGAVVEAAVDPLDEFFVSEQEAGVNRRADVGEMFAMARGHVTVELLAFWVAAEEYAIEIVQIQEIIKVPVITEVPRAPKMYLGVISLRGTIVPIIDLRLMLGLEQEQVGNASRILILRSEEEPIGLLVDRVSSVVRFDREAVQPVPRTMQREASDLLQGVGRDGDRMLIILDLPAVLAAMEAAA